LNKANKIIDKQKIEIQDLKNQLNSFKNIDMNKINNIQNEINNKNNQLNQLRQQLQNIYLNNNQNIQNILQNDKCVNFITTDSSLFYAIPCNGNSTFAEIEEKLYKEYPEYRETNNTFLANGTEILRFKTINENKIGTGKPVMLIKPS
jgi:glutamyl/glutaminyl-tRNA synthetase